MNPHFATGRLVLAGLALIALGVAACTIPTSYEAQVGKTFRIRVPAGAAAMPSVQSMLDLLKGSQVADEISVSVSKQDNGAADILMMLWGDRTPTAELTALLRKEFSALSQARFEVSELQGTVRGSLAEKIGHQVFDIEVSGSDAEAIRQQILQQLAEQGFTGDAAVTVREEDGQTEIEIEITDDQ